MKRTPIVELSDCVLCELCTDLCPKVFVINTNDYVQVMELDTYPEPEVDEVIKNCPADCITWEEQP
ncbi:ferredoxin [Desulfoluna spongiiphila]|uniref:Ferredoxin n=1 Tax=Desulfoluna spongiiphila TaxID=419481 RepID=A0A1G5BIS4_9BACT|nr:ferredoxin [Desulfoluna spongiiphila]SCX90024.1 ferredoxin [Desulfoluna spongiiphila]VVS93761.1 4fe-4s single cluster domain of ferredoxin i [Desulfoluna spongiiphila]